VDQATMSIRSSRLDTPAAPSKMAARLRIGGLRKIACIVPVSWGWMPHRRLATRDRESSVISMRNYPLLDVRVSTPTLELRGATDDLLDQLADLVRAGKTHADPPPYDDPMSFYETDPDLRVAKWLRAIWRRRGTVEPEAWRLYFVVMVDGRPVG